MKDSTRTVRESRRIAKESAGAGRPVVLRGLDVPCGFRPEFLDFRRGIHVGNLTDHERITRILKLALEARYGQPFVTERWGRGVYWRWIGFLPRANRAAKPVSSGVSFGCSKFSLLVDTDRREARFGLQIERGYVKASKEERQFQLQSDWDWHRLVAALKPRSTLAREMERLIGQEGFRVQAGAWSAASTFSKADYPGMAGLRRILEDAPKSQWVSFQLYYGMTESDVRDTSGLDLVESMLAVYEELVPVMNMCMQIRLASASETRGE
jgi:hypothetical protein